MKPRHVDAYRNNARAVLEAINASLGQSYLTLSVAQVTALIAEADRVRYQKPANAKGARARHFYDMLQRHAQ